MRAIGMSVRKPSRPWLIPMSGTSSGARRRAIESIVPSPPTTIATSACARERPPAARLGNAAKPVERAVSASITTSWPLAARNAARRDSGSAMSGLTWRPISATRRKRAAGTGGEAVDTIAPIKAQALFGP